MKSIPLSISRAELGTATYGMNQFADMTEEEFSRYYLSPVVDKDMDVYDSLPEAEDIGIADTPDEMDWRTKGEQRSSRVNRNT